MNTRVLPGMFAPTYQELQCGYSVCSAAALTCPTQASTASGVASIEPTALSRRYFRQSPIHVTWWWIDIIMFVSTEGLPGPVMVNKFGMPGTPRPRYVPGPVDHCSPN